MVATEERLKFALGEEVSEQERHCFDLALIQLFKRVALPADKRRGCEISLSRYSG